jgi:hypothetical protein
MVFVAVVFFVQAFIDIRDVCSAFAHLRSINESVGPVLSRPSLCWYAKLQKNTPITLKTTSFPPQGKTVHIGVSLGQKKCDAVYDMI